jgi:hypothetical protein
MGVFKRAFSLVLLSSLLSPVTAQTSQTGVGIGAAVDGINPQARILRRGESNTAELMTGLSFLAPGDTPRQKAEAFLLRFSELTGGDALRFREVTGSAKQTVVHFDQWYQGARVLDRSATVTLGADGLIRAFNSDFEAILRFEEAVITAGPAADLAIAHLRSKTRPGLSVVGEAVTKAGIVVFAGVGTAVYEVHTTRAPMVEHLIIRVDAHASTVLSVRDAVIH